MTHTAPFSATHPRFHIPGWRELLGADETMSAQEMVRHFIITGETGSGKTASAVAPLLQSILRYPEPEMYEAYGGKEAAENLRAALLAIDPKQELEAYIEAAGRPCLSLEYRKSSKVLHFFEGHPLQTLDPFRAMDLILQQSDFFTRDMASTREPIWNMQAASILRDFVAIDIWIARRNLGDVARLWDAVSDGLAPFSEYRSYLPALSYDAVNYFKPHSTLINLAANEEGRLPLAVYLDAAAHLGVPGQLSVRLLSLNGLAHNTRSGVIWMVNGILSELAADELASCVSLNPLEAPPKSFSVMDSLNGGEIVLYKPVEMSPIADLIGRCLKTKFFECAFQRENVQRPFFYVVDEAHRFLTCGEMDGEQHLLDRCRAFRTGVVLASQSIASMSHRLQGRPHALQIILNNCGNALYFRTSDTQTQDNLQRRIPGPPVAGRPHVIALRPLTSLGVGTCYALRSDGSWSLGHIALR